MVKGEERPGQARRGEARRGEVSLLFGEERLDLAKEEGICILGLLFALAGRVRSPYPSQLKSLPLEVVLCFHFFYLYLQNDKINEKKHILIVFPFLFSIAFLSWRLPDRHDAGEEE